jgi:CHAT domain-containing protein/tetratricopeptide (TPR) repeat protein
MVCSLWPDSPQVAAQGVTNQDHALELNRAIQRELPGGGVHSYRVVLSESQYLCVVVDQRGIDVIVRLFGPDGKQLREVDSPNGALGPEPISDVAEVAGLYRLDVASLDKDVPPGNYEVKITELRQVAGREKATLEAAEEAYEKGIRQRELKTPEARNEEIEQYKKAAELWASVGNRQREADMFHNIAQAFLNAGDYKMALLNYQAELPPRTSIGDLAGQAQALTNIGGVYSETDQYQKALVCYNAALVLRKKVNDPGGEAATLNNIGVVFEALGETQKALDIYAKVLPLREISRDLHGKATTLNNIARLQTNLGNFQVALDLLNEALPLMRTMHEAEGEADVYLNIGRVYLSLGRYQEALDFSRKALDIQTGENSTYWRDVSLNNIGVAYEALKDYQNALKFYEQALKLQRGANQRGEAHTLNNMGRVYSELGNHQQAIVVLNEALPLMKEVIDRRGESIILNRLGFAYSALGDQTRALDLYARALEIALASRDRAGEAGIRYNLARCERDRKNLPAARLQIEQALRIVKPIATSIANRKLRESYFASVQKYYELYIELLMQLEKLNPRKGYGPRAFRVSEEARARTFLERLSETGIDVRQGVSAELLDKEHRTVEQLNDALESQIRILSSKHSAEETELIAARVNALTTEYDQVQADIRRVSPKAAALKMPEALDLVEIQHQVLGPNTVLLEYAMAEARTYLWAVTSNSISSFTLTNRSSNIKASADKLIRMLATTGGTVGNFETEASTLSSMLFPKEMIPRLRRFDRIVVVTNGLLQYVPFAALADPGHPSAYQPMVFQHEVVSLTSASTFAMVRRQVRDRSSAPNSAVVFADPVFSRGDERFNNGGAAVSGQSDAASMIMAVGSTSQEPREVKIARILAGNEPDKPGVSVSLPRLDGTRDEANMIRSVIPDAELHFDWDANLESATDAKIGKFRVLHFATHGIAPDDNPELAGVVLSLVSRQGKAQQGYLGLPRVYNLNLAADLVVLSACETGLGKDIQGEGLVGLTRGFMYAGAPRVVASLWRVREDATKELMDRFYRRMVIRHMRPAAALSAAQASMWQDQQWAPSDWTGFVFYGEWK